MRQTHWLEKKIERTLETFPWYGLLHPGGADGLRKTTALGQLPLMTSERLEKHYYGAYRPPGDVRRLRVYRTSGTSSGIRKTIYYSEEDERRYAEIKSGIFGRFLQGSGVRNALSDMGTGHAADTARDVFRRIGLQAESVSFRLPVERHLERLEALRPGVLYTMPSILDRLLQAADDPARFRIRKIILVGEPAPPAWQANVAERLGIRPADVMDTYGSIEIGTLAYFSHRHGRYLFAEGIEAEGLRDEPLIAGSGTLGDGESVLALTSTEREMFPAVRYVTYDVVRDLRPIEVDGERRMSFQALVRRLGPELKHGEKISVYDIENVVFRHLEQAVVRIQVDGNKLRVHVRSEGANPERLAAIEHELMDRIPEIGQMIRNRLLDELKVVQADSDAPFDGEAVKHKKIYYK
jgi:phenylacetate-coenzyme A ligase PaaK-like adenylate-forming protein